MNLTNLAELEAEKDRQDGQLAQLTEILGQLHPDSSLELDPELLDAFDAACEPPAPPVVATVPKFLFRA